ncbi:hypothetical protein M8J75_003147 [Diaphorina citri]|nr:hypothetical protein M8J75_003147 [Diaphorina citri]
MFSTDTQSYHSLLYLFDLDQWFSAQMPEEYDVARSGPRYTALHDLTQALESHLWTETESRNEQAKFESDEFLPNGQNGSDKLSYPVYITAVLGEKCGEDRMTNSSLADKMVQTSPDKPSLHHHQHKGKKVGKRSVGGRISWLQNLRE